MKCLDRACSWILLVLLIPVMCLGFWALSLLAH